MLNRAAEHIIIPCAGQAVRAKQRQQPCSSSIALGAGLLAGIASIPILAVTGIVTRDAARTFNALPVAGLGQLPARSELLDSHGNLIAYYYPRNIYRVPVRYSQIAPVMRNAIIAIEDERFYQHGALDLRGTIRALTTTLSGADTQGGSDIAQQYVKNACILAAQNREAGSGGAAR